MPSLQSILATAWVNGAGCSASKSAVFYIFTPKLCRLSVTHIPFEGRCQTPSCVLPPSVCCCVWQYSSVVTQTSSSWLIYPLPCENRAAGWGGVGDDCSLNLAERLKYSFPLQVCCAVCRGEHTGCERVLLCKLCKARLLLDSDLSPSVIMTEAPHTHTHCKARVL